MAACAEIMPTAMSNRNAVGSARRDLEHIGNRQIIVIVQTVAHVVPVERCSNLRRLYPDNHVGTDSVERIRCIRKVSRDVSVQQVRSPVAFLPSESIESQTPSRLDGKL